MGPNHSPAPGLPPPAATYLAPTPTLRSWPALTSYPTALSAMTLTALRNNRTAQTFGTLIGALLAATTLAGTASASESAPTGRAAAVAPAESTQDEQILLRGVTKGSYFWDDGSGRQGDTGMPAIGKPMQKGLFASPSWPLGTEGYIIYKGKKARFFIGDRGPGIPSERGVMLDIDGMTFAELTGSEWNHDTLTVASGEGHIEVEYVITKWGDGPGHRDHPLPFSAGAWRW
jgi:hypothetical protein